VLEHSDHCQINLACLCSVRTYWSEDFIFLRTELNNEAEYEEAQEMKTGKAGGKNQPIEEVENNPSSNNCSSFYGDEEIVDCEPESPARYLCDEGNISPGYDYWPAQGKRPDAIILSMTDFPAFSANDSNVRSRRRSQNVFERGW
jgi:hypothetical protein